MDKIIISNLDDLKVILDRINTGEEILISNLDFSVLSKVTLKIIGKDYNGKLNSNIVVALNNYQNELQKLYCMVRYNSNNLRSLSLEDKKLLTVEYEIKEGCTEIINALTSFFDTTGRAFEKMTAGMSGNQKTACMIFLILCVTVGWCARDYYTHLASVDENQKDIAGQRLEIEKIKAIQEGVKATVGNNPKAEKLASDTEKQARNIYSSTIKLLPSVDNVEITSGISSVNLDKNGISSIIATEKSKLQTVEANKILNIESIKKSLDRLAITCSETGSDYTFILSVDKSFIEDDEISIIFDNFKNDKPINVFGSFKVRDGVIEKANATTIKSLD